MKQTRRKELKTNDLSVRLQQLYATLEQNSTFILAGVLGVVLILVIGLLLKQRMDNKVQAAWTSFYELREKDVTADRSVLERVGQLATGWSGDSNLGPAVLQLKGTMESRLALSLSEPKDDDQKIQLLKAASATYQDLLNRFAKQPEIAAEARMSLAGIEESLVVLKQGSVEKVRQYYQDLVATKPNVYADLAAARLADLDQRLRPLQILATRPATTTSAPAMNGMPPTTQPASRPIVVTPPRPTMPAESAPAK